MAKVVIVGAGLGGLPAAYEIRKALGREHEVTVVNPTADFQFVPSNPWVAVGWRQRGQTSLSMPATLNKKGIQFRQASVQAIDAVGKSLSLSDGSQLAYDKLVITTGPKLNFAAIPGLGPNGFTHSICTLEHAEDCYRAYQEFLKKPGPIVIGAAQGASCFGPAYEFALILDHDLRRRKLRSKVPITFVTSEPYIGHLGLGGVGDSKGLLEHELRDRDIRWICNAAIDSAEQGLLRVTEHDDQGTAKKQHEVKMDFGMILPSFLGVDAVAGVTDMCNPKGFVLIDQHNRNPKYPDIFAAGVCVAIPPVEATPVPTGAPKTGYMIEAMVTAITENIAADLAGNEAKSVASWNTICLADMGNRGAVFVAMPQMPPRNHMWAKQGRWVHMAKVGFEKYFLYKMKRGSTEPIYEKTVLRVLGVHHSSRQPDI